MFGYSFISPSQPDTIAAIDLGSNSFHLIVARVIDGEFQVIDRVKEMVRLASGLDGQQRLSNEAQQRALICLERFAQRIRDLPPGSVRAVGTNTLRAARNGEAFRRQAEAVLGHPIEVIAGREEARLIYLAVAQSFAGDDDKRLVVDIGGGSTEVILGEGFDTLRRESLHMGCVSFSEYCFKAGKLSSSRFKRAITAARLELNPHAKAFKQLGWQLAIGCSGTIKALGRIVFQQGWSAHEKPGCIDLQGLYQIRDYCIDAGHVDNLDFAGLSEARRAVIAGGCAVLIGVFEALKLDEMQTSQEALREGLLYGLMGRIHHEDARTRSVPALAARFSVDVEHAQAVSDTAVMLLQQVASAWSLEALDFKSLLSWAAFLHEVGMAISHAQYHKHGAYLLENADISGFSQQDQRTLALLVRCHRRKWPVALFDEWDKPVSRSLLRLTILLRLAVLLHRDRGTGNLSNVELIADGKKLQLNFQQDWLASHPLTQLDLEAESVYLSAGNYRLKFS